MNPLLAPWSGPYGGVPPFGAFAPDDLKTALELAMAEKLAEVERIAADPREPTFANTVAALERAGRTLDRVQAVYGVYTSTMNDDSVQSVEREMAPRLAALDDMITQNERLFERLAAVYKARGRLALTPEERRLVWVGYTNFVRSGAKLDDAAKRPLFDLNQRLARLYTNFRQNVLAEEGSQFVVLRHEADLAGLPASLRASAASRGAEGPWAIVNTRSMVDPFLTHSERRDLREKVWRMFTMRGDNGNAHDNRDTVAEIVRIRARRARLLGFPAHAHLRLDDSMAKTPERAMALMKAVWLPAVARVREEVADMQTIADHEGAGIRIAPWDYRHYAEKVRKAKYGLDQSEVKPYLQLERLREGMFWVASELFGFRFVQLDDALVPVVRPDVRVYRVIDGAERHVGLWYFDPYARPGKDSGAWMSEYRRQSRLDGEVSPIVSNNANFVKGAPGEPILLSWDDARTLFHEFGHALHGLASNVVYPSLAGTAVARDYVEFPSQLIERWLATPEVLGRFAIHHETGRPMPSELAQKLALAEKHDQGFATVEYLASALIDMQMHLADDGPFDVREFERHAVLALAVPAELTMRHRPSHFGHVFGGDSYAAGYYSYLWADTLAADAFEAFVEAGGPYDKTVAGRLLATVFRVGNTIDPADGYRAFRGRNPAISALLRSRGFPVPVTG